MNKTDPTIYIEVNTSPKQAFEKISQVAEWWISNVEGRTTSVGDVFRVGLGTTWKSFKVAELVPEKKIVWVVFDCFLPWASDIKEWVGTTIVWTIIPHGDGSRISFVHEGLVNLRCGEQCLNSWGKYIHRSLFEFIQKGKGSPDQY